MSDCSDRPGPQPDAGSVRVTTMVQEWIESGINWEDPVPLGLIGKLSQREAYEVQLELLTRRIRNAERQAGWKVGATSAAILEQQGLTEPLFGYLMEGDEARADEPLNIQLLQRPAVECELCFVLDRPLSGPRASVNDAMRSVGTVHPAMELVEERIDLSLDLNLVIADNIQQFGYLLGAGVEVTEVDLADIPLTVLVNGKPISTANSSAVLGNPINAVVWLANKLSEFGISLPAGSRILSGSLARQIPLSGASTVEARFAPLGSVSLSTL
jgi:2-keto-4-pentenoate hydratase